MHNVVLFIGSGGVWRQGPPLVQMNFQGSATRGRTMPRRDFLPQFLRSQETIVLAVMSKLMPEFDATMERLIAKLERTIQLGNSVQLSDIYSQLEKVYRL